jgi:Cu/Ag efflux protein CusF
MKYLLFAFISLFSLSATASSEWVRAEVVRVDTAKQRIVLKHEPIPSIKMPSMTMRFEVAKAVSLDSYRPGDRVQFQFKETSGSLDITALEKLK